MDTVKLTSIQAAIARAIRSDTAAYSRIEKAAVLIALDAVTKVGELEYNVLSLTKGNGRYTVRPSGCSCADSRFRGVRCSHQWAVRILLSAEKAEQTARFSVLSETEQARLMAFKAQYAGEVV